MTTPPEGESSVKYEMVNRVKPFIGQYSDLSKETYNISVAFIIFEKIQKTWLNVPLKIAISQVFFGVILTQMV